ncbi:MAG: hypothetical protein KKH02_09050, partial [Proteobacteria bacterium]|nr:hypothetical protein [Pseudomonadota bacterium]
VGMSASFTKTITETDVYLFAGISGDFNPMHTNEEFAKLTPFKTRIAHGALTRAMSVMRNRLTGKTSGAIQSTKSASGPALTLKYQYSSAA